MSENATKTEFQFNENIFKKLLGVLLKYHIYFNKYLLIMTFILYILYCL